MVENMLAEVTRPDQRAAKKIRPGHCTKKSILGGLRVSWVDLSRDRYIALPKLATSALETKATSPSKLHVLVHASKFEKKNVHHTFFE